MVFLSRSISRRGLRFACCWDLSAPNSVRGAEPNRTGPLRKFRTADRWISLRCRVWLLVTIVDIVGVPVTENRMPTMTVVNPFGVGNDIASRLLLRGVDRAVDAFILQCRDERFGHCVVPTRRSCPSRTASQDGPPRLRWLRAATNSFGADCLFGGSLRSFSVCERIAMRQLLTCPNGCHGPVQRLECAVRMRRWWHWSNPQGVVGP